MRIKNRSTRVVFYCLALFICSWVLLTSTRSVPSSVLLRPADATQQAGVDEAFGKLPLSFEINEGQVAAPSRFLAHLATGNLLLTPQEAIIELPRPAQSPTTVQLKLKNANQTPALIGEAELPGKHHYLLGQAADQWRTNISTYARVRYQAVYPGIDLVWYGRQTQVEYDFIVAPGAQPQTIKLALEGVKQARLDDNGDLVLQTPAGVLRQTKPVIYQEVAGVRQPVEGGYQLSACNELSFIIGAYDHSQPLVIDPLLNFAAQGIGGTLIAVDAAGNAYLAGSATGGVPLVNPLQDKDQKLSIQSDAYVAKLNAAGTALVYSTYLGGNASDLAQGLAVDAAGNVTIVGETTSTDFTGTEFSPFFKSNDAGLSWNNRNTGLNKTFDLYSLVVDPTNPQTLYGVNGNLNLDVRVGQAVKSTDGGNTWTTLTNGLTAGASVLALDMRHPQTLYAGTLGGVFKTTDGGSHWNQIWSVNTAVRNLVVNPGNTDVLYACLRLSGGLGVNEAGLYRSTDGGATWQLTLRVNNADSVTVDPANPTIVYVGDDNTLYRSTNGGATWSLLNGQLNFSVSNGAFLVDPSNSLTLYAGGGGGLYKSVDGGITWRRLGPETNVFALAISRTTLYLSAGAIGFATAFPGGLLRSLDGGETWLPTSVTNIPRSLVVDPVNPANVYASVGGRSNPDAFIIRLNAAGSQVVYSRLLSGAFAERATSVAVNATGAAYVAGYTNSADFPVTSNAFQANFKGDSTRSIGDCFLAKLDAAGALEYATYFGGSGDERLVHNGFQYNSGPQLALSTAEQVYLSGTTASTDLPLKQPLQASYGGGASDAFIAKLDLTKVGADSLVYSTYLGSLPNEISQAIGAGAQDQATVLLGGTSLGLPVTPNSFQARESGLGYLAKLQANGMGMVFATYLGFEGAGLTVDHIGNVYVTGWGAGAVLPVTPGALPLSTGQSFALKLNTDASALYFATPLVGSRAFGIAADVAGDVYVTGSTENNIPTTPGAFRIHNSPWFTVKLETRTRSTKLANVSAASFSGARLAPDSIATAFGVSLAEESRAAGTALPNRLADVEVVVKDSRNVEHKASLFFVAPTQVNYLMPSDLSLGLATVSLFFNGQRYTITGTVFSSVRLAQETVEIVPVAPGLFTANANGQGVAAAVVQRVSVDGSRVYEEVARYDPVTGRFVATPIAFGPEGEQLYLILFGTGLRRLSTQTTVNVTIGGVEVPVLFAGGQPTFTGLDQLNVQLPRTLAGRGDVEVLMAVENKLANPVRLNIK